MTKKNSRLYPFLISAFVFLAGILLCIPAIQPILKGGLFPIHDDTQVVRVYEMYKSLKGGMFPVRWVEDLGYGFGYPIFNFYAPLAYYVGALGMFAGLNLISATQLMFIFGALLAFVTMYLFIRSLLGQIPGLVAGVLYVYFPYHAVNIYIRGAVGELYAYAFLPLVLWGLVKLFELFQDKQAKFEKSLKWILVSSIGIALVATSHNLTLYMLGLILAVFMGITVGLSKNRKSLIGSYVFSLILGGMLASFYIIPAALESSYTNVSSQVGGGADYPDHFVCIKQLYESQWGFGGSVAGCTDGLSFKVGKINVLLFVVSFVTFIFARLKKQKNDHDLTEIISYVLLGLSIFFLLPISKFFWDVIPGMEFIQYPWRFLNFVGLFFSIIVGFFVYRLTQYSKFAPIIAAAVITAATLFFNIKLFVPQSFTDKTVSEYVYQPDIRLRVSKISDEYMPKGFVKPETEDEISMQTIEIKGKGVVDSFDRNTKSITSTVTLESPSQVKYYLAYFPTWNFYVNDKKVEPSVQNTGVFISLQPGTYSLEARYQQTLIEKIANSISLIGILTVFAVIIGLVKKNYGKKAS